jgi:hypothetical protein
MAAEEDFDYDAAEDVDDAGIEAIEEEVDVAAAVTQDVAFKKLYAAHPECSLDYIESIVPKLHLEIIPAGPRAEGITVDKNHLSYPFLNKYEITKIIGHRANELSQGARPYINLEAHVTDPKEIAHDSSSKIHRILGGARRGGLFAPVGASADHGEQTAPHGADQIAQI